MNPWRGQYTHGDHGYPMIMLDAAMSHDLWFQHAYFGMSKLNNDLKVLGATPIFNEILQHKALELPFIVNGNEYKYGYYLDDEIYLEYAIFVKFYTYPQDKKRKMFKTTQEATIKDVKQNFGDIKEKFNVLKYLAQSWDLEKLRKTMYVVLILHNMIIKEMRYFHV